MAEKLGKLQELKFTVRSSEVAVCGSEVAYGSGQA